MKLYLEDQGVLDEALSPRSTIKVAFKRKIISNGDLWIEMMLDRNRTSHMYDETVAKSIVERIKKVYIIVRTVRSGCSFLSPLDDCKKNKCLYKVNFL